MITKCSDFSLQNQERHSSMVSSDDLQKKTKNRQNKTKATKKQSCGFQYKF